MDFYIPIAISLASICYYFRNDNRKVKICLILSILISIIFASLRFEFGQDYISYSLIYMGIQDADLSSYHGRGSSTEILFLYVLKLFPTFTIFIVTLSVIWFSINYIYIFNYIQPKYYWIIILYMYLDSNYILGNMVAMRTSICAVLFLIALPFLFSKDKIIINRIIYVLIIILASLFHSSSLILVLLVFINFDYKNLVFDKKFILIIFCIVIISFFSGYNIIVKNFIDYFIDNFDILQRYSYKEFGSVNQSINSIIFRMMTFFIYYNIANAGKNVKNEKMLIFYKIGCISSIMILFCGQSLISDRFMMILNPIYIISILHSFSFNPKRVNYIMSIFLAVISLYIFINKMNKPYSISFYRYKTIFSASYIP